MCRWLRSGRLCLCLELLLLAAVGGRKLAGQEHPAPLPAAPLAGGLSAEGDQAPVNASSVPWDYLPREGPPSEPAAMVPDATWLTGDGPRRELSRWLPPATVPQPLQYHWQAVARGYYLNDHRYEFTGMEATFAAEGVLRGGVLQRLEEWELSVEGELFLNQPFDRNILVDTPERRSFANNFAVEPLQISQLYLEARRGDCAVALGRFVTPFGRFYFPNYRNNFDDSPFIRAEAILFRETGLRLTWDPAPWVLAAALTNGGPEQDTNSSKALVARCGFEQDWFACGASVKWQDGIGSEGQKVFNNHAGIDAMCRWGPWTLSGEAIYDQYGLRRPGIALNDIFWGRSLYYRDLNNGVLRPLTGVGYYVQLGYEGPLWSLGLNYGEFYPTPIGNRRHDAVTRRGMIKASRHWTPHFETYAVVFKENDLKRSFDASTRRGIYVLFGTQFTW